MCAFGIPLNNGLETNMAAPAFATAGTFVGAASSPCAVPVPSGVGVGDIVLAFIYCQPSKTVTPPAGFTEAPNSPGQNTATSAFDWHVYWKRATAADSGTYSFTTSGGAPTWFAGVALRYTGCVLTGNPIDVAAAAGLSVNSTSFPSTSITTTGSERLIVWSGVGLDGGFAITVPSGYTTNFTDTPNQIAEASLYQASAGSTGTLSASSTDNAGKAVWVGALIPADPQSYRPIVIPNRYVGPMALRNSFRHSDIWTPDTAVVSGDFTGTSTSTDITVGPTATGVCRYFQ